MEGIIYEGSVEVPSESSGMSGLNVGLKRENMLKKVYSSACFCSRKRSTKKGRIETTSIIFIPSFRNFPFSGAPANLKKH